MQEAFKPVLPAQIIGLFSIMSSVCLALGLGSDMRLQVLLVLVDGMKSSKSFWSTPSLEPPDVRIPNCLIN